MTRLINHMYSISHTSVLQCRTFSGAYCLLREHLTCLKNKISYYGMFSILIWLAMIKADMACMKIIWGRRKCLSIWWRSWLESWRRKSWSRAWPWIHFSVTRILRDHSKSRMKVSVSQWITWMLLHLSSGSGKLVLNRTCWKNPWFPIALVMYS